MRHHVGVRDGGSRFLYEPFTRPSAGDVEEAEYRAVLRSLGTPEQIKQKIAAVDVLLEEKERRDWLFARIKTLAVWTAAVAAGWFALKGLLAEFLTDFQR